MCGTNGERQTRARLAATDHFAPRALHSPSPAVAPSATPPGSPSAALKARFGAVNGSVPGTAASTDASGAAPAAVPSLKRPYVVNKEDQEAVKRIRASEVTLRTRADALHGTNPLKTADFNTFRASFASRLEAARRVASGKAPAHSSVAASRSSTGVPVQGARRTRAQDPIIMISSSPTALVNMYNVKRLLEEGVFVPPEQARAEAAGHAEPVVQVMHQRVDVPPGAPPPRKVRYLIVDNTEALQRLGGGGVDAWDRVVAVFTTGQAWQFRSYPRSDPRDLFKHGE